MINRCFGGFGTSLAADREMKAAGCEHIKESLNSERGHYGYDHRSARGCPHLIATVERMGDKASGGLSELAIVEIPDGVEYEIDEHDGIETIHETHRSWP